MRICQGLFSKKGQVAEALIHYRKLLELQPDNMEVHNIVGTVLTQQGRVSEGIEEWQKVLAVETRPMETR